MRLLFDRGTLLCVDPPAGLDLGCVDPLSWDPRVSRHRAPAYRHAELVEHLRRAGVAFQDAVHPPWERAGRWCEVFLRPYQEAALLAWTRAGRRGVVVLPTGSGKTRLAIAAMARTGRPTLCLVPTRVLLHQWRAEIAKLYDGPIGRLGDGEIEAARISVATFESAYRRMHEIGNRFDLVVVDEAHHFGTGARDETLEMCTARARLGLTATPPEPATPSRLVDLVGPTVYELAVGELAGKWLAPFEVVVLELRLSPDERRAHEEWMGPYLQMSAAARQANPWGNWRDLVRTLNRSAEGRAALAGFRKARRLVAFTLAKAATVRTLLDRHRGSRVLVFTADNASAYAISREHLVMPITCDIGRKERDLALARFRRGEIRVLVSARVLNEGLDVPDAEVAIVVGATQGAREHVQRVGRLLRPAPGKRAVVYELVTIETSEVGKSHWRRKALGDVPAPLPR